MILLQKATPPPRPVSSRCITSTSPIFTDYHQFSHPLSHHLPMFVPNKASYEWISQVSLMCCSNCPSIFNTSISTSRSSPDSTSHGWTKAESIRSSDSKVGLPTISYEGMKEKLCIYNISIYKYDMLQWKTKTRSHLGLLSPWNSAHQRAIRWQLQAGCQTILENILQPYHDWHVPPAASKTWPTKCNEPIKLKIAEQKEV